MVYGTEKPPAPRRTRIVIVSLIWVVLGIPLFAGLSFWFGWWVLIGIATSVGQIAHPLDVAVEPSDLPDFDWEIWVDETAESVLGTEAFDSLESRFSAIAQITAVAHEDREIYLVQAEDITREDLETAIRRAVDRADPR